MTSKTIGPDNGFDFEITDFADARDALDNFSLSIAAETARPVDAGFWQTRRRPRSSTDRALAGVAIDWLTHLSPAVRPVKLSEQMPRLVNQLATLWAHPQDRMAALDALLTDQRGGRRGLPYELRQELRVLRNLAADLAT